MTTTAVVGTQWGDEGKGKIVDTLAIEGGIIVRYAGGPNAGHTIYVNGKKVILHLVPSSVTRQGTVNIVGPGVLVNPDILMEEIGIAQAYGSTVLLDPAAHIITPWDVQLDKLREAASGMGAIGTTLRGIGPCAESRTARRGIRLGDLALHVGDLHAALEARNYAAERIALIKNYGATPMSLDNMVVWCAGFRSLALHFGDTRAVIHETIGSGGYVLFEGAQGEQLDIDRGTYPFVTSTNTGIDGIAKTTGVRRFDKVTGVAKAYITRVGNGPFPTKLDGELADKLRELGHEYGSTTGRPRDVGWLDLVLLKYAIRMSGITELVMTKLDVLTGMRKIQVAVRYLFDGKPLDRLTTLTTEVLNRVTVEYVEVEGWQEDITGCRSFSDLPLAAQDYVRFVEREVGLLITMIGVGPERDAIIMR
ncbi:MAG: adenylosuccinate synthase [Patescibacteria group bacterium]|jgi:adenylosuccinate synthase